MFNQLNNQKKPRGNNQHFSSGTKDPKHYPDLIQISLRLVRHSFEGDKLNSILNTENSQFFSHQYH